MEDRIIFKEESPEEVRNVDPWTVLIVDDEGTVHSVTEIVLRDVIFEDKPIKLKSAYSAKEAMGVIKDDDKIAIVLLDVVMETMSAGLDIVDDIRNENPKIRIILRTGQAGTATVSEIINMYDIHDFKEKQDLTSEKLKQAVILALRNYRDIQNLSEDGCD